MQAGFISLKGLLKCTEAPSGAVNVGLSDFIFQNLDVCSGPWKLEMIKIILKYLKFSKTILFNVAGINSV